MKLNPKAFGLACGSIWGALMALMTIINLIPMFGGYAGEMLLVFAGIYPGYTISWFGVLIGAIYGFIDAFIGGWLFVWVYNKFDKE
ncbi:MAG: hypothetical protein COT89_02410 [Candidatus Colwellbacteria bacterium CG10_big_fil_rev_8_21_14_0_10_42_22]|uniref:Membrane-associated protein n=1 Tax=Candidatus Colwellbacteria bacterium CG10_big_fil_rev_8_21_14_0_10_42_22 TaxID=1974540 RepID=A0A2H0VHW3_9BACT|nr:MAG: hypothetical protein COT89_02410 [Candidatus Colwellbacteria bacterium CG10_big_fil_rev_8_21_14_0_10_42_22]